MKLQIFLLSCVLQSIYGFNIDDLIIYPSALMSSRVVGGQNAAEGFAPYQCSMQWNRYHFCGCSIISNKWVLTAVHCVYGQSPTDFRIMVGSNDLRKPGKYYQPEKFTVHGSFDQPRYANDIAVIKVVEEIEFNDLVQPIELMDIEVEDGAVLLLTGWGRIQANGAAPQILQRINLKAISTERCRDLYGGRNVHDSHMCTLTRVGEEACNGDSGGPLVIGNGSDVRVVGVVNFGVPCAHGSPDVYAKVSHQLNWIRSSVLLIVTVIVNFPI